MNILVVDDEKGFVDFLKERLAARDHSVEAAYDGKEGLECIKSDKYDLIFLDQNMPELTGVELLKYIKQNNIRAKTVFITAYPDIDRAFVNLMGCEAFLSKPVTIKQIDDIVDRLSAVID